MLLLILDKKNAITNFVKRSASLSYLVNMQLRLCVFAQLKAWFTANHLCDLYAYTHAVDLRFGQLLPPLPPQAATSNINYFKDRSSGETNWEHLIKR